MFEEGCATKRRCFDSFEQRILSLAPSTKKEKRELRENINSIPYFSLSDIEKTIYKTISEMKGNIKREHFTDFEWEALKRFYDIHSPKDVTPQEYIFLRRVAETVIYNFGTK